MEKCAQKEFDRASIVRDVRLHLPDKCPLSPSSPFLSFSSLGQDFEIYVRKSIRAITVRRRKQVQGSTIITQAGRVGGLDGDDTVASRVFILIHNTLVDPHSNRRNLRQVRVGLREHGHCTDIPRNCAGSKVRKLLRRMARPGGLELPTFWFVASPRGFAGVGTEW
jgi:hypothetical protein